MAKMFDFECQECGHEFEDLVDNFEIENELYGPCPECECINITKIIGTTAKHFSWSTWRTPVNEYY